MAGEDVRGDATGARGGFLSGVGRRWRWIVGGTLAALIGSAAFVLVVPPRYAAVATVLAGAAPRSVSGAASPNEVAVPAESLASADLARAAVDRLALAANSEFAGDAGSGRSPRDAFLSRLLVAPVPGSRAITITFASRDRKLAAQGANTVAELAVQSLNEARARSVRAAEIWLAGRIADGMAKVASAEAKVEAFRVGSGLLSGDDGQKAGADQASDLSAKLSAARAASTAAGGKASLLRDLEREGRLADASPAIADESFRRLIDQRVGLKAEIADASRTLLPLHPRMKDLAARLAALDGEIRNAAEQIARTSEAEARRAGEEADVLAAKLAEQSKAASSVSGAQASLHALEAEAQSARDALASYQEMAREAEARRAAEAGSAEARVLAWAEPPGAPVFPKVAPILAAGAAAGFALSCLAAAIAAIADARRRAGLPSPQIASARQAPPAAPPTAPEAAPPAHFEPVEPTPQTRAPGGALDSASGLVATLRRLKPEGRVVALVAGDRAGQALSLALETARRLAAGRAAVLVDLGETQDWLADILYRESADEPAIAGLSDLIAGRVGFGDLIRRDLSSQLDVVLPGRDRAGGKIDEALTAFGAAYGAVVLHASDWRSDWARAAAGFADAVIVVAPAARSGAALDEVRHALGDACPIVLAYPVRALQGMSQAA
jgi:uncharacterized protein involved in exopolysaccharide biosynthesis